MLLRSSAKSNFTNNELYRPHPVDIQRRGLTVITRLIVRLYQSLTHHHPASQIQQSLLVFHTLAQPGQHQPNVHHNLQHGCLLMSSGDCLSLPAPLFNSKESASSEGVSTGTAAQRDTQVHRTLFVV
jgi:hypothetical protein